MNLPKDPYMLLSFVNMKLRDEYPSLTDMCDDLDVDMSDIIKTLAETGFEYIPEINQFR